MFHHSMESLDQGQSNGICLGGLRILSGPEKLSEMGGAHVHCTAVYIQIYLNKYKCIQTFINIQRKPLHETYSKDIHIHSIHYLF